MNTNHQLQARLTAKIAEIEGVIDIFAREYSVERMDGNILAPHIARAVETLKAQLEVLEEVMG